jgi:hypothetical protein
MTEIAAGHSLRNPTITALFCALAGCLYAVAQVDPSPSVALFVTAAPVLAVILWLQRDAVRTGVGSVHDLGLFLWIAWPVVIPWYAWKTRGRAGLHLTVVLFALILSAHISWLLVSWLMDGVGAPAP